MKESKKKNLTPLPLRVVQWFFPKLEAIAPSLAHRYFVHLFLTPFRFQLPEKEKEFIRTAEEFTIQVSGKKVQCYRWGTSGPKVIMVHGWAGRAGQFREMIPRFLQEGFQVMALDGPAHGRSDGRQTDLPTFSASVKALFEVGEPPVGIIAHSFGGVASLYAIMNGLPARKLINIASPTIGEKVIGSSLRTIGASKKAGAAIDKYLLKNYGKTFDEFSSQNIVKHLPAPLALMAIHDEDDAEVTIEHVTELKKAYPSATIHLTKGLGHTRILKDPGVITKCIEFMK